MHSLTNSLANTTLRVSSQRDPIACNASMRQTGLSATCSLQYWRLEMLVAEISDLIYRILLGLSIHRKMSSFAYMRRVLKMNCVKLNAYSHHQKGLAGKVKQNSSLSVRNSPQHEWCKTHRYVCGCSCKLNCLVYWMNLLQSVRRRARLLHKYKYWHDCHFNIFLWLFTNHIWWIFSHIYWINYSVSNNNNEIYRLKTTKTQQMYNKNQSLYI